MKRVPGFVKALVAIGIPAALLAAYLIYNPGKALQFIFPDLSQITYVNSVVKKDSVKTEIAMVFENKNPYKLSIDSFHFEVYLSDTSIANETVALHIGQERFGKDTVTLPLNLNAKKIRKLIGDLQSEDSTGLRIEGFAVYETIFGRKKISFDRDTRIEVPVPPKLKIVKVERNSFSLRKKNLDVTAYIEIINKGKNLNLELTKVRYDFSVQNTLRASGLIASKVRILPGTSTTIPVPMKLYVYHPLKTAWKINTNDDRLHYNLSIRCRIRENISEKSFASDAQIQASGTLELVK